MNAKVNLQKKISVTRLIGKVTVKRIADAGGKLACGRFVGVASGTKTGVTDFGEWTALSGQFRAINQETGETMDSGICFMPDVALDMVKGQLAAGAVSVEFAFDLEAALDENSPVGFSYRAAPVIQQAGSNPLLMLLSKIDGQAQLAAPKTEPEAEPVADAKPKNGKK